MTVTIKLYMHSLHVILCMCVRARACVRACVRVRACVCACVRACVSFQPAAFVIAANFKYQ